MQKSSTDGVVLADRVDSQDGTLTSEAELPFVAGPPPEPPASPPPVKPPSPRLLSLDTFRGLTVIGMLLVNNIALDTATPKQLTHADWSGAVHFADLVFPWFLLIVGVALPFSLASFRKKNGSVWLWIGKALLRTAGLFALGCLLESIVGHQVIIGMSVLQLIGFASLIGALGVLVPVPLRVIFSAGLLLGYAQLLLRFPVPDSGARFTEDGNVIKLLHDAILEPMGLKGVLSIIPAGGMVLLGTAFGDILKRSDASNLLRAYGLLAGGLMVTLFGYLWQPDLPFNKPLWTPSYILFTGGLGLMLLGGLYILVDIPRWRKVTSFLAYPFQVFGSNAILAYAAPILMRELVLQQVHWNQQYTLDQAYRQYLYTELGRWSGGWAYTVTYIGVWWLILLVLHLRRWYIRL
jgi:predicted acyltransferase